MAIYGVARLGVMRLNAARLNYYQPWLRVLVNGVARNCLIEGASINQLLNHEPDTASLRMRGFTPTKGQEIKMYMGDTDIVHQLFGGHILNTTQVYLGTKENIAWDLDCIDYTWLLNRRKVLKKYTNQSATDIVNDIMNSFTSGFTTTKVVSGLATIGEISFTDEDVSDALTRIAQRIGGYWYIDYAKVLHFFLSEDETAGAISDGAVRTGKDFKQSVDLSQVVTRVRIQAGGSAAGADVPAGSTMVPVEDASWYPNLQLEVQSGPQRFTYTSRSALVSAGSTIEPFLTAPSTKLVAEVITGSNFPDGGTWSWAFTFVDADGGETNGGPVDGPILNNSGIAVDYQLSSIDTGPSGTVSRKVYRTKSGEGTFFLLTTINDNSTTTINDTTPDASLGSTQMPTANTTRTAAASTTVPVKELSAFSSSGGWVRVGEQIIRYTGRSASSGVGTLTGVPSSGSGAITSPISAGSEIATQQVLTGIPASGAGAILYDIQKGDPINIVAEDFNQPAEVTMAALLGGDGKHEHTETDGRLSWNEASLRCTAIVNERKDPIATVDFETRDQTVQVGRNITFNLTAPAITGTFKIQSVTLSEIGIGGANNRVFPKRTVKVSSKRFSFEDLLRQIKGRAA